jgi:hypothetical protein
MNHPRIYRRFALAAIAALLVGLMPATVLADGEQTVFFDVAISGTGTVMAGSILDVTVHAFTDSGHSSPALDYHGTVTFSSTDGAAVLPSDCPFDGVSGVCAVTGELRFHTVGDSQTVTATDMADASNFNASAAQNVVPADADHFVVSAPSTASVGTVVSVTVTAKDQFENVATGYVGTVALSSTTDAGASFGTNHLFVVGDHGLHVFTPGATFAHIGTQTVTATDTLDSGIKGVSDSVTVAQGTPVLAFTTNPPGGGTPTSTGSTVVGGPDYTPTTHSTSPLGTTIALHSGSTGCTFSAGIVSFTALGTCVIDATQAGNDDWAAPTPVTQTITVGQGTPVLAFTTIPPGGGTPTSTGSTVVGGPDYTPDASSNNHAVAIVFALHSGSTGCTISAGVVSFTALGTCVIDANQAGNDDWASATVAQTIDVLQGTPVLAFTTIPPGGGTPTSTGSTVVGGPDYTPDASSNNHAVAIVFGLHSGSTGCTISAGVVSFTALGTCKVDATQASNDDWASATVTQTIDVLQGTPVLAFTSNPPGGGTPTSTGSTVVGASDYTPAASSASPVAATFSRQSGVGVCTVVAGAVRFLGVGTCVVEANQASNTNWLAAAPVTQTIDVGQGTPVLAFMTNPPGGGTPTATGSTVIGATAYHPTASSPNPAVSIVFALHFGSIGCQVDSGVVTFTALGTCLVDATQAGNTDWIAATPVTQTIDVVIPVTASKFLVTGATSTVAGTPQSYSVTAQDEFNNTVTGYTGTVHFTSTDGAAVLPVDTILVSGTKTISVTLLTAGTQSVTATDTVTTSATGSQAGIVVTRTTSTFHPINPFRMLDTRTGNGLVGGPATLKPALPVGIPIRNRGLLGSTVANNATAITANVTIVTPTARSYVYIGPVGVAHPETFTIAFNKGDTTAYGSTIAVGADGKVYATYMGTGSTHLLIDVTGYFTPDATGESYHTITPVRLVDTRKKFGISSKLVSKVPREFTVRRLGIPLAAKAVTGNLTVTGSTGAYAAYLGPTRQVAPTTSTINFAKGQIRANSLTVALSPTGTLWVTYLGGNRQTTDVVFDVTGYYTAGVGGDKYVPITPVTLLDTAAPNNGLSGVFHANVPRNFTIINRGGVPLNATGITGVVSVNGQTSNWALFVGPADVAAPTTSALNFVKTDNCSNGVTVALNPSTSGPLVGTLSITYIGPAGSTTNILLYVTGYFVP